MIPQYWQMGDPRADDSDDGDKKPGDGGEGVTPFYRINEGNNYRSVTPIRSNVQI